MHLINETQRVDVPIPAASAYNLLLSNPQNFLKRFPVKIFGANRPSGVANYAMLNRGASMRPGSVLGKLRMHETESFDIKPTSFLGQGHGGHTFSAHLVRMDEGTANMNFYRLDASGPPIMLTGELSGCSMVMLPATGGHVEVAHVRPRQQTGQQLYGTLNAALPNAEIYGASGTSGHYDSDDRCVSIIGVRAGGQWFLFAQKKLAGADGHIRSVYQIFPDKTKL